MHRLFGLRGEVRASEKHLRVSHELTLDEYTARWGLATDYLVVAPNYTAIRSAQAKKLGLGGAVPGRWPTSTG
jgi:predicted transcriptional regulator